MAFRAAFACLWCGVAHRTSGPEDLEGWAQLCPGCLGRAGENPFLRFRLRSAMEDRARAREPRSEASELRAYYEALTPEYDDWYLRRGRYDRGPIAMVAWQADLDAATRWLDAIPWSGRIVELAAGTGWWSPILAPRGELWCFDAAAAPLERARDRLLAHGLRAHLHVRDAWDEPDGPADGLFAGFWLSHVRPDRLAAFMELARRWLRPGGSFAFIDSQADRESLAVDDAPPEDDGSPAAHGLVTRRLADGRSFRIPVYHHPPGQLAEALGRAGFEAVEVGTTARFFVLGQGRAPAGPARPDP